MRVASLFFVVVTSVLGLPAAHAQSAEKDKPAGLTQAAKPISPAASAAQSKTPDCGCCQQRLPAWARVIGLCERQE